MQTELTAEAYNGIAWGKIERPGQSDIELSAVEAKFYVRNTIYVQDLGNGQYRVNLPVGTLTVETSVACPVGKPRTTERRWYAGSRCKVRTVRRYHVGIVRCRAYARKTTRTSPVL